MADDIRILLADDHPVVRKGLQMALAEDPGLAVVAEAADGEAALTLIQQLLPQIAVLDIDMPNWTDSESRVRLLRANCLWRRFF